MALPTAGITRLAAAVAAAAALIGAGVAPAGAVDVPLPTPPPHLVPDPHVAPPVLTPPAALVRVAVPAGAVPEAPAALTGTGGDPGQAPASNPSQGSAPYPGPSADEQAALPPESGRTDLEEQQWSQAQDVAALDAEFVDSALLAHGSDGRFVWPIVFRNRPPLTQRFGCSDLAGEPYNPLCASKRWHPAIDLGVASGMPIFAAEAGVAHVYRSDKGYGNHVLISHGDGWFTLYAHLSDFAVRDRQVVAKAEMIGLAGSTGYSTGSHLHFEIRHEAEYLDPCAFLKGC